MSKHEKLLKRLFSKPIPRNIKYKDIENALVNLGLDKKEGSGSAVSFSNGNNDLQFHKPHPSNELKIYVVKLIKEYLVQFCSYNDDGTKKEDKES